MDGTTLFVHFLISVAFQLVGYFQTSGFLWMLFYSENFSNWMNRLLPKPKLSPEDLKTIAEWKTKRKVTWLEERFPSHISKIQSNKQFTRSQLIQEITYSIPNLITLAILVQITYYLYVADMTKLYWNISDYGYPHLFGSFSVLILVNDAYIYWLHRVEHSTWMYTYIHKWHHKIITPSPFSAMNFHPAETVLQFLPLITPMVLFPFHMPSFMMIGFWLTLINLTEHAGYQWDTMESLRILFPSAIHHDLHHVYYKCNYGVYFTLWDRMMGTWIDATSTIQAKRQAT